MTAAEHIAAAAAIVKEQRIAAAAADRARRKLLHLESDLRAIDGERESLRRIVEERAARRYLDNASETAAEAKDRERLEELDLESPKVAAAIRLQGDRVAAADAKARAAGSPLAAAVLPVAAAIQADGIEEARAALAQLAAPLAKLIAGDHIRASFLGERFAVRDADAAAFVGGAKIVGKIVAAIPPRLLPPELSETALQEEARKISRPIIVEVNKGA